MPLVVYQQYSRQALQLKDETCRYCIKRQYSSLLRFVRYSNATRTKYYVQQINRYCWHGESYDACRQIKGLAFMYVQRMQLYDSNYVHVEMCVLLLCMDLQ
jgi:predicted patatin/cPLA2 family phospholipase